MFFPSKDLVDLESFTAYVKESDKQLNTIIEMLNRRNNTVDQLFSEINSLSSQMSELKQMIVTLDERLNANRQPVYSTVDRNVTQPIENTRPHVASRTTDNKTSGKRTFYCQYSPRKGVLQELDDSYKGKAAFVATVSGDEGSVSFNNNCIPEVINALSSLIFPFFDYELQNQSPTTIIPQNSVKIKRRSITDWEMDGKISLIIK